MNCAECKGRGFCGLIRCPIISRFQAFVNREFSNSYMGAAPSIFIGTHNYPRLSGGPLLIDDNDNPPLWIKNEYSIEDIVNIRARTIRAISSIERVESTVQEIALSEIPLDVEVLFEKPVQFNLRFDGVLAPVGLRGTIINVDVLGNASPQRSVDRATSDTDLSSTKAVDYLFSEGIDTYRITRLLSAGLLGLKRRMVPTRWAITAVDDMVGNQLKTEVVSFPFLDQIEVHFATLYANQIICLLVPGNWKFEMVEIWKKNSFWSREQDTLVRDGEGCKRKTAYSPIAGAYYSARLAVGEYLKKIRRSASIIIIRQVSNEYWAPLGTWVIREATRQAMENPPLICESLDYAIRYANELAGSGEWFRKSQLIHELRTQRTLQNF